MLSLLQSGNYTVFLIILTVIIISLSFHEFGHAYAAKRYGDNTAERMGRLTLNPIAHIDPLGLAMVVLIGFGFARPVPTDPRNFNSMWAQAGIAAAGPAMNLLIAFIIINLYGLGQSMGLASMQTPWFQNPFVSYTVMINLLLMLFNMLPIGPLDGHYILPYLLPSGLARRYRVLNARFGMYFMLGLVVLSYAGLPIFSKLWHLAATITGWLNLFD